MHAFSPAFTGESRIESSGSVFLEKLKDRVQSGLLTGKPHWRSRYEVTKSTPQELTVRASDFMTANNVGLNEVTFGLVGDHTVKYSVRYKKWAAFAVGLSALLGLALVMAYVAGGIQGQLDRYTFASDPLMNRTVGLTLFWGQVVFWALIWPWILILLHKPFARKLLERIIREVDVAAQKS